MFIATSLDGFIARKDGSIDWLMKANAHAPAGEDGGYKSFISQIDRLVMGRYSFEKVLSFDEWPYGDLPVIVMSHQSVAIPKHIQHCVSISSETPIELVNRLSKQGAKHLYVDGGVTLQGFLAANLIDEITITIAPVLLGNGRPLFGSLNNDIELHLIEQRALGGGFVQVKYRVM